MDSEELFWFLQRSFPTHRPACVETGEELEVEHDLTYTVLHVTPPPPPPPTSLPFRPFVFTWVWAEGVAARWTRQRWWGSSRW